MDVHGGQFRKLISLQHSFLEFNKTLNNFKPSAFTLSNHRESEQINGVKKLILTNNKFGDFFVNEILIGLSLNTTINVQ